MIESLFELLKDVTEFKNIKIITGQSDEKITKNYLEQNLTVSQPGIHQILDIDMIN